MAIVPRYSPQEIAEFNKQLSVVGYSFNPNITSTKYLDPQAKEVIYSINAQDFAVGPINQRGKASRGTMKEMVDYIAVVKSFTPKKIAEYNEQLSDVGYSFNPSATSTSELSADAKQVIYSTNAGAFAVGPINGRNKASRKTIPEMVDYIKKSTMSKSQLNAIVHSKFAKDNKAKAAATATKGGKRRSRSRKQSRKRSRKRSEKSKRRRTAKKSKRSKSRSRSRKRSKRR